ncbi:hypothetical protein [Amycolatopsis sp. NPDC051372]|uniref:beta family protein n=1 Tax=unclassified Amycolatopsis TaxID=2618356 RepID=UPI003419C33D
MTGVTVVQPGDFSALVALRAKEGELTALGELHRADQLRLVQPLLQFDADGTPTKQLDDVETAVRILHNLGRVAMLDATDVAEHSGYGAAGALGGLTDRLTHQADLFQPIAFIPVVRSDLAATRIAPLGRLCRELGAGGALRIRRPTPDAGRLGRLLEMLRVDPEDLDLIVDLEYLPELTSDAIAHAQRVLGTSASFGGFRSTSLLAGSVPPALSQTEVWEAPRVEEAAWDTLVRAGAQGLRFGDYGAVHPGSGPAFPPRHVTLRYTCWDHWLYSRERIPKPDAETGETHSEPPRNRTFRAVCRHVVESEGFAGAEFSWGDRAIREAAEGRGHGLGSTSKPVAFATSHHLAHLASRAA